MSLQSATTILQETGCFSKNDEALTNLNYVRNAVQVISEAPLSELTSALDCVPVSSFGIGSSNISIQSRSIILHKLLHELKNNYEVYLVSLTIKELKKVLQSHNLKVSGNKEELLVRITQWVGLTQSENNNGSFISSAATRASNSFKRNEVSPSCLKVDTIHKREISETFENLEELAFDSAAGLKKLKPFPEGSLNDYPQQGVIDYKELQKYLDDSREEQSAKLGSSEASSHGLGVHPSPESARANIIAMKQSWLDQSQTILTLLQDSIKQEYESQLTLLESRKALSKEQADLQFSQYSQQLVCNCATTTDYSSEMVALSKQYEEFTHKITSECEKAHEELAVTQLAQLDQLTEFIQEMETVDGVAVKTKVDNMAVALVRKEQRLALELERLQREKVKLEFEKKLLKVIARTSPN